MKGKNTVRTLAVGLLLAVLPHAHGAELYAQAIGQPPEPRPAPPQAPAAEPEEPAPPEERTAAAEEARGELSTRILIGAGVALALGALAGSGNGGGAPAGGEAVPEHP